MTGPADTTLHRQSMSRPHALVALALILGLGACGDSTAPEPSFDDMLSRSGAPLFDVGAAGTVSGGACRFDGGLFSCRSETRRGLTVEGTVAFFDAAGNAQAAYDRVTTASHRATTSIRGTLTDPDHPDRGTHAVDRAGTMTVSGLAGAETSHTLNGVSTGTIVNTPASGVAAGSVFTTTIVDSTVNVVVPAGARAGGPWPLSGYRVTVTTHATSKNGQQLGTPMTVRGKITYNGTSIVAVEVTGANGTQTCTRDLSHGRIFASCFLPD